MPRGAGLVFGFLACLALILPGKSQAQTLTEAVAAALAGNPDVLGALENQRAVEQTIGQAEAGYRPTVDIAGAFGREWADNTTTRAAGEGNLTLTYGASSITLSQPLWDGGAADATVARARAASRSARLGYATAAETVAISVADAYLETLKQHELLALLRQNVTLHEEILAKIRAKFESGAGNEADVQQTETRVALAKANLLASLGALATIEARFLRVVGDRPQRLTRPAIAFDRLPENWAAAEAEAMALNPGLLAVQQDLVAAESDIEGARAAFSPTFNLELFYADNTNQGGTVGTAENAYALLKMNYNLFRGGADVARVQETVRRAAQARQTIDQIRQNLVEAIRAAWENYQASKNRLPFLAQHVAISTQVVEAYHNQFQIGKRTLLDVLNSETELFTARSTLTTEEFNHMATAMRLIGAMGRLRAFLGLEGPDGQTPRLQLQEDSAATNALDAGREREWDSLLQLNPLLWPHPLPLHW